MNVIIIIYNNLKLHGTYHTCYVIIVFQDKRDNSLIMERFSLIREFNSIRSNTRKMFNYTKWYDANVCEGNVLYCVLSWTFLEKIKRMITSWMTTVFLFDNLHDVGHGITESDFVRMMTVVVVVRMVVVPPDRWWRSSLSSAGTRQQLFIELQRITIACIIH